MNNSSVNNNFNEPGNNTTFIQNMIILGICITLMCCVAKCAFDCGRSRKRGITVTENEQSAC